MNKQEWHYFMCQGECDNEPEQCRKYLVIRSAFRQSLLPTTQWFPKELVPDSVDKAAFEDLKFAQKNIKKLVDRCENIILLSENCGNGKTSWAIKLMLEYFYQAFEEYDIDRVGMYINVSEFLFNLKESFNTPNTEIEEIKAEMYTVKYLILDDIGSGKMSEYDRDLFYTIVDKRNMRGLFTFYTTNCLESKLQETLGKRLFSRIYKGSTAIVLYGKDKRGEF